MNANRTNYFHAVTLAIFVGAGSLAQAYPDTGASHSSDGGDKFNQVAVLEATPAHHFDIGGMLVISAVVACLGYAFLQKDGGIWADVTQKH